MTHVINLHATCIDIISDATLATLYATDLFAPFYPNDQQPA